MCSDPNLRSFNCIKAFGHRWELRYGDRLAALDIEKVENDDERFHAALLSFSMSASTVTVW